MSPLPQLSSSANSKIAGRARAALLGTTGCSCNLLLLAIQFLGELKTVAAVSLTRELCLHKEQQEKNTRGDGDVIPPQCDENASDAASCAASPKPGCKYCINFPPKERCRVPGPEDYCAFSLSRDQVDAFKQPYDPFERIPTTAVCDEVSLIDQMENEICEAGIWNITVTCDKMGQCASVGHDPFNYVESGNVDLSDKASVCREAYGRRSLGLEENAPESVLDNRINVDNYYFKLSHRQKRSGYGFLLSTLINNAGLSLAFLNTFREQYYMNRDDHDDKRVNVTQGIRHIVMNPDAKLGLLKLPENCKTKLQSGKWLVKSCFTDALQSHVENSLRQFTDALRLSHGEFDYQDFSYWVHLPRHNMKVKIVPSGVSSVWDGDADAVGQYKWDWRDEAFDWTFFDDDGTPESDKDVDKKTAQQSVFPLQSRGVVTRNDKTIVCKRSVFPDSCPPSTHEPENEKNENQGPNDGAYYYVGGGNVFDLMADAKNEKLNAGDDVFLLSYWEEMTRRWHSAELMLGGQSAGTMIMNGLGNDFLYFGLSGDPPPHLLETDSESGTSPYRLSTDGNYEQGCKDKPHLITGCDFTKPSLEFVNSPKGGRSCEVANKTLEVWQTNLQTPRKLFPLTASRYQTETCDPECLKECQSASYSCSELSDSLVGGRQFREACSSMQSLRWDEPVHALGERNVYTTMLPNNKPNTYIVYDAGCPDPTLSEAEREAKTAAEQELTPEKVRQKIEDPAFYKTKLSVGQQIVNIQVQFAPDDWKADIISGVRAVDALGAIEKPSDARFVEHNAGRSIQGAPKWLFAVWFSTDASCELKYPDLVPGGCGKTLSELDMMRVQKAVFPGAGSRAVKEEDCPHLNSKRSFQTNERDPRGIDSSDPRCQPTTGGKCNAWNFGGLRSRFMGLGWMHNISVRPHACLGTTKKVKPGIQRLAPSMGYLSPFSMLVIADGMAVIHEAGGSNRRVIVGDTEFTLKKNYHGEAQAA
ncbi:unnamed protein product [Amoebophrya sp. A120]|nr:unnamed protein product [Amoebophrya sp. A120]|eukprot:GSA120T00016077001.1